MEESLARQDFLRHELKKRRLDFKWHDARMSFLEGVFSRGDRRLSKVVKNVFERGCRFDSWGDQFRFDVWQSVLKDNGINPEFYTYRKRNNGEVFPWDHISPRIDKEFLYHEYEKSLGKEPTPDCKTDKCSVCGICDHKIIKNVSYYGESGVKGLPQNVSIGGQKSAAQPSAISHQPPACKIRLTFSKTGAMKCLGHLELAALFSRAVRRAEIPVVYSSGFHPLPKIKFSPPIPVGIESIAENADMELSEYMKADDVQERLNKALPEGIKILEAKGLLVKTAPLSSVSQETTYLAFLKNSEPPLVNPNQLNELIDKLMAMDEVIIHKEKEGRQKSINIRPLIKDISLIDKNSVQMILYKGENGSVKPTEVMAHLLGLSKNESILIPILKIKEMSLQGKTEAISKACPEQSKRNEISPIHSTHGLRLTCSE
jgi:radical SAM-linked protein